MGRAALAVGLAAFVLGAGAPAAAPGVLVLVSRPVPSYVATADALSAALGGGVRRVDLGGAVDAGAAALRTLAPGSTAAVVAIGTEAARACAGAAPGVPVLYAHVADPAGAGLLALADAWGISTEVAAGLAPGPVLDRVRKHLPDVRRLGVPYDPARAAAYVDAASAAAKARGLVIVPMVARAPKDVPDAWRAARPRMDALWIPPVADRAVLDGGALKFLLEEVLRDRMPIVAHLAALRERGAVLNIEVAADATGLQLAALVAKVLRGEPPAEHLVRPDGASRTFLMKGLAERLGVRALAGDGATVVP